MQEGLDGGLITSGSQSPLLILHVLAFLTLAIGFVMGPLLKDLCARPGKRNAGIVWYKQPRSLGDFTDAPLSAFLALSTAYVGDLYRRNDVIQEGKGNGK